MDNATTCAVEENASNYEHILKLKDKLKFLPENDKIREDFIFSYIMLLTI